MESFSKSLGFQFRTHLAFLAPVEKLVAYSEGRATLEDQEFISRLALPLNRALEITTPEKAASTCGLIEGIVVLDVKGNAMLCSASSMESVNAVGNFLEYPLEELQRRRREKTLCRSCLKLGLPGYFAQLSPEFERIAAETISAAK